MTRLEIIRLMDDEELLEFLYRYRNSSCEEICQASNIFENRCRDADCDESKCEWFKQEVTIGEEEEVKSILFSYEED